MDRVIAMPEVSFTNHYKAGHSYRETWTTTDLHCPGCGKKAVWRETGGGDYYVGERHICASCSFLFHMPNGDRIEREPIDYNDQQRLFALRVAASAEAGLK